MIQIILSVSATSLGVSKAITSEYQERLCRYKRNFLSFDHAKVQYLTQRTASLHIKFTGSPVLSFSVGHALGIYLPQFSRTIKNFFYHSRKGCNSTLTYTCRSRLRRMQNCLPQTPTSSLLLTSIVYQAPSNHIPRSIAARCFGDYAILSANKPSFTTRRKLCRVIRKAMSPSVYSPRRE